MLQLAALPSALATRAWAVVPLLPSSSAVALFLAAALLLNVAFIFSLRSQWRADFAHRHRRTDPLCPSHKTGLRSLVSSRAKACPVSGLATIEACPFSGHAAPSSPAMEELCEQQRNPTLLESVFRHRRSHGAPGQTKGSDCEAQPKAGRAISSEDKIARLNGGRRRGSPLRTVVTTSGPRRLSPSPADGLDMDHVYLSFADFVWAYYFVAANAVWLWLTGIAVLLARQRLQRLGWLSPRPYEADRVVARLLLEGVGVLTHYVGMKEVDGTKVALFVWRDFPMLNMDAEVEIADLLTIEVDVERKRMVAARLDGDEISAADAMTLVWFDTIFSSHVKSHAVANWGVNVEGLRDAYMRQCGVVTVMYNYFGNTLFPRITKLWWSLGWSEKSWERIEGVFDGGLRQDVCEHMAIRELRQHSEVGSFILRVRNHFLNVFSEHRADFPGIDGEALFVGTVIHSLDHTLMEWNLEDPLWLDVDSPRFGVMAKLGRFVRVGFVEDLPGLTIRRHCRDSPSSFFREIHRYACTVDRRFADHMDCCIVK